MHVQKPRMVGAGIPGREVECLVSVVSIIGGIPLPLNT